MDHALYTAMYVWIKTSNAFFLCFSQITSIFRIDEEIAHHHEQHEVGIGTPVILRERSWKIRHEQEGLECSSSSNIGSHQGDDSTSAQNDCFTSVQVNQAIMAADDEVEGVYSNTNGQGLLFLSFSFLQKNHLTFYIFMMIHTSLLKRKRQGTPCSLQ